MKKVLVTGGAGFVGANLIKRLLSEGHEVTSIDDYSTGKKENHQQGAKYIEADISHEYNCYDYPDIIFHLAAKARIGPSFKDPEKYIKTNYGGTYNIVKYCTEKNIPLIYAGSSSHHSGRFKNPYTFSKDLGEDIIRLYQEHFGLKASIARFYNVYGPHQLTEGGYTTLIGKWLNNIEKGIPCEIYGDGTKRRDFTHVEDIVDGLIRIMNKKPYNDMNYWFEFGRGKNYSVNEVAKIFGIDPVYREEKSGEAQETLADNTIPRRLLGWEPKINLEDYIKRQL
jgi:UDP-glucose 4-epimerase